MAKIPYRKLPGKVVAAGAVVLLMGGVAAQLAIEKVVEYEGYVPEAYLDPVGIPTICFGDIADVTKADVAAGKTETFAQCVGRLNNQLYNHAKPVYECLPDLEFMPPKVQAAMVSMAYNIGPAGFCKSSVAGRAKAGDWEGACKRIAEIYRKAGGRELPGLVKRRADESRLCLEGITEYRREKSNGANN